MLSIDKIKAVWSVFQQGKSVTDPNAWRGHQVTANMIAGLLFAIVNLLRVCGYDFGIDMQTCADIAVGLLAAINLGITVASSANHGLPTSTVREAQPSMPSPEQPAEEEPTSVQAEESPDAGRRNANPSIDDDVRARALEWAKQHASTNVFTNDA
jgi:hypothetical protein